MVVLNEMADLGGNLSSVPAHDEHLANGPARSSDMSVVVRRAIVHGEDGEGDANEPVEVVP